jgi:hypothetical protein
MKANEFLNILGDSKMELVEWSCPKCGAEDLPDEEQACPSCGHKMSKQLCDDKLRKYYETMYQKVFSKIKGKIFETDLVGANSVRFTNTLCKYGVIRRLRNGRFVEMFKIPKEFVISCFVENNMKKLREMTWRRRRKQQKEYQIRPYQVKA